MRKPRFELHSRDKTAPWHIAELSFESLLKQTNKQTTDSHRIKQDQQMKQIVRNRDRVVMQTVLTASEQIFISWILDRLKHNPVTV